MHAFVDASKDAYAAAVYIRVTNRNGTRSFLVFSKSRLCPVKGQSIPRLELLAVLIDRHNNLPSHTYGLIPTVFLQWIESVKPNPERFVEIRLKEIRKSSAVFHYVPSSHNPADIATRRILPHDLKNEQLWTGPTLLAKEKAEWPQRTGHLELETKILSIQDKEVSLGIQREVVEIKNYSIHELFDVNRYGSWYKYLHLIINVLCFIKLTSSNKAGSTKQVSSGGVFTPEEYKIAEKIAFREVQNSVENNTEEMEKWQLDKDVDGILRCRGRLQDDNASQFKLVQKTIESYCSKQRIKWKFITEHATWQSRIYERLIGLSERSLVALRAEVGSIVNSRPLTHVADDATEVFRPIDFLCPYAESQLDITGNEATSRSSSSLTTTKQKLLEQWQKALVTSNKFWQLWQSGYLPLLRKRTQRHHRRPRSSVKRTPIINEVVLVEEENQPRGVWKIGKIVKLYLGHGNVIRTALVRMPSGHILTRPINYLPPLEITREMQFPALTDPNIEQEAVESIS
ncbi:unnamed protein product [Gongylonema pulchrum]|uniref:DUF5641 domain-containing protein n=1 Tax=Gongylonema pulchrum TaxID=637853 RepID=A0A3P6P2M7_9BILA|nr:unnamed protein product [Gongylonema pulchrum]